MCEFSSERMIQFSNSVTVTLYVLSDEERQIKREATSLSRRLQRSRKRGRQYEQEQDEDDEKEVCYESKDEENEDEENEDQDDFDRQENHEWQPTCLASKRKRLKGIYMDRRDQGGYAKASMLPANWSNRYRRYRRPSASSIMNRSFILAV